MLNAKKGENTGVYSVSFFTNKCDSWNLPTNLLYNAISISEQTCSIDSRLVGALPRKNPLETDNLQNTELSYEK